jgi:chromosome segregation ATPase
MMQLSRMPSIVQAFEAMGHASLISAADGGKLTALVQSSAQAADEDGQECAPAAAVYESHSAGIVDTLEGLLEKAQEQLDALRKTETSSLHNFEMLAQSLSDEIKFGTKDLAAAKAGVAAASEAKSVAEGDLGVTSKDLASDIKELADVHHNCESTAGDFEAATTTRSEELKALADAKSAISSNTGSAKSLTYGLDQVSFLQREQVSERGVTNFQVVRFLRGVARKQDSTQLAQLANRVASTIRFSARAGQDPFAKVKGLISDMIASLEASAETDASHKAYCDKETAETTEKKEDKTAEISKLSTAIDKTSSRIAVLEEEVAQLTKELASIASSKASYDAWFRAAEATYTTTKADMEQGISGVQQALKILGDYYAGSSGAASGIIGLLEVVESDFTKGLAETEAGFSNLKAAHEHFGKEAELATTMKSQDVKYKSEEITKLKKALGESTADRKGVQAELDALLEYLGKLHEMCVAKAEPYAERVRRRDAELAGLKEALEVLAGEAVLLQRGSQAAHKMLRGIVRHA